MELVIWVITLGHESGKKFKGNVMGVAAEGMIERINNDIRTLDPVLQ